LRRGARQCGVSLGQEFVREALFVGDNKRAKAYYYQLVDDFLARTDRPQPKVIAAER
jgi:hypothetical protein